MLKRGTYTPQFADVSLPPSLRELVPVSDKNRAYVREPTRGFVVSLLSRVTWSFLNPRDGYPLDPRVAEYQIYQLTNQYQQQFIERQRERIRFWKTYEPHKAGPDNRAAQVKGTEPQVRERMWHVAATHVRTMWRQIITWQQSYIDDHVTFVPRNAHGRRAGDGWNKVSNSVSRLVDPFIREHTYIIRRNGPWLFPILVVRLPHPDNPDLHYHRLLLPTDVQQTLARNVKDAYHYSDITPQDISLKTAHRKRRITHDNGPFDKSGRTTHDTDTDTDISSQDKDKSTGQVFRFLDAYLSRNACADADAPAAAAATVDPPPEHST